MNPLITILACLIVMYITSQILRALSIPRVVSYILSGMILSLPQISLLLFDTESMWLIKFMSQIGVILLLFFVGLQINFKQFEKSIAPSAWISLFNTAIPLMLGYLASRYYFNLESGTSIIIGVCLSVSATAIALDLMEELGKLKTRLGALIVSAGTFDDLVELFLITILLTFIETATHTTISQLIIGIIIFSAVILFFRFLIIPFLLRIIPNKGGRSEFFTAAIIIALLMATLAEYLGIGAYIGALFSGLIIRQVLLKEPGHKPWERAELTHSIHTLAFGFFVPFFFFNVGYQTELAAIWTNIDFGLVITAIAIFGTVIGSAIGYYISFHNLREAFTVGWAMNAKGDTEIVIAELALTAGVITIPIFSSLIFMAVISTLISPFILRILLQKIQ